VAPALQAQAQDDTHATSQLGMWCSADSQGQGTLCGDIKADMAAVVQWIDQVHQVTAHCDACTNAHADGNRRRMRELEACFPAGVSGCEVFTLMERGLAVVPEVEGAVGGAGLLVGVS
jgi:hypothetical protein